MLQIYSFYLVALVHEPDVLAQVAVPLATDRTGCPELEECTVTWLIWSFLHYVIH